MRHAKRALKVQLDWHLDPTLEAGHHLIDLLLLVLRKAEKAVRMSASRQVFGLPQLQVEGVLAGWTARLCLVRPLDQRWSEGQRTLRQSLGLEEGLPAVSAGKRVIHCINLHLF